MTQVTGSNITDIVAKESILSIQLSLNGLSFCVTHKGLVQLVKHCEGIDHFGLLNVEPAFEFEYARIVVVLDTTRVVLTPKDLFDSALLDDYMSANGIDVTTNDVVVNSDIDGDIVAGMVLGRDIYDLLFARYGSKLSFVHPLLINVLRNPQRPTIELNLGDGVVSLTIINKDSLLYADSLSFHSVADLLFYLRKLNDLYPFSGFDILFSGSDSKSIYREVSRYFKRCSLDKEMCAYIVGGKRVDAACFNNVISASSI